MAKTESIKLTHAGADVVFSILSDGNETNPTYSEYIYKIYSGPVPATIEEDPDEIFDHKKRYFDSVIPTLPAVAEGEQKWYPSEAAVRAANKNPTECTICTPIAEIKNGQADYRLTITEINEENHYVAIKVQCFCILQGNPAINRIFLIISKPTSINVRYVDKDRALLDFEPWRCGAYAIDESKYLNIDRYQAYVNNGFSERIEISDYKLSRNTGDRTFVGYRKGTVPKAGDAHEIWRSNPREHVTTTVEVYRQNDLVYIVDNGTSEPIILNANSLSGKDPATDGITRLGIVLVGAGGASGNCSEWYEDGCCGGGESDNSGGSGTNVKVCGSAGGGGGTVWGVLRLDKTDSLHHYFITIGQHSNNKGGGGGGTYLYYRTFNAETGSVDSDRQLAKALGGGGGLVASKTKKREGGEGGKASGEQSDFFWCTGVAYGTKGTGYKYDADEVYHPSPVKDYINFLKDESGDAKTISTYINSESAVSITISKLKNDSDGTYANQIRLSGGNSFGHGSYRSDNNDSPPGLGGGGASDKWGSINYPFNTGEDGGVIFYY